jgi:hypothetical protein
MVDINLIGDDQTQFEGEESEKEFQESYEPEPSEPTPSSYLGSSHIDDTDYTRMISRGGSKKLVYILAACSVVLIAAVAWFMFQPGKSKKPVYEPPTTALTETENSTFEDTSKNNTYTPETNIIPTSTLSPALREVVVSSHRGISTVSNILGTIPSNVNFTMISYSDGEFLLEFLTGGDAEINNVSSQIQQTLASGDVKLLSKESRTVQNRSFRQALVNGNVNVNQSGDFSNPQEPTFYSANDLQIQMTNICRQAGLTLKQFEAGREKSGGEFMMLPIMFKATGQKSNVLTFLQQLNSSNLNISFAKISLIADETELINPNITLLMNIELYRMS